MSSMGSISRKFIQARGNQLSSFASVCVAALYAAVVGLAVIHHEPWADEAQAWLLARDAGLWEIWGRLLHYEGSPGLWHTLLHGVIALHLPYSAYNLISAALAFVGVWLLIRRSPLPVPFLVALPFTYYLCYQYAVIARSYSLLAPLLFAAAAIYRKARERPFLFTALILLIAGISVHGVIISGAIWLSAFGRPLLRGEIRNAHGRRVLGATAVYALVLVALMLAAWPAKDVAFVENRGMSRLQYLPYVTRANLEGAFTGEWMTSIGVVLLSLPFLRAGGGLLFFIAVAAGLLVFGAAVYAQIWHFGILFLAWVFALWISAQHVKMNPPAVIALAAVIVCQCYWTAKTISWDWSPLLLRKQRGSPVSPAERCAPPGVIRNRLSLYGRSAVLQFQYLHQLQKRSFLGLVEAEYREQCRRAVLVAEAGSADRLQGQR